MPKLLPVSFGIALVLVASAALAAQTQFVPGFNTKLSWGL